MHGQYEKESIASLERVPPPKTTIEQPSSTTVSAGKVWRTVKPSASVQPEISKSFIRYDKLEDQELLKKTQYVKHVRFKKPLKVRMDGKKRISVITMEE